MFQGTNQEFELSPLLKTLKVELLSGHVPTRMVGEGHDPLILVMVHGCWSLSTFVVMVAIVDDVI